MEEPVCRTGPHIARRSHVLLISLFQVLLLACSAPATTVPVEKASASRTDPEMLEQRRELLQRQLPERIPAPAATVTGEVPEKVMDSAIRALEKLTGAERSAFKVVMGEETIWPDGALGCPQPGMVYTQATVPGYHVVLEHDGREYDYRAGGTRYLMLCLEPGLRTPSGKTAPTSLTHVTLSSLPRNSGARRPRRSHKSTTQRSIVVIV